MIDTIFCVWYSKTFINDGCVLVCMLDVVRTHEAIRVRPRPVKKRARSKGDLFDVINKCISAQTSRLRSGRMVYGALRRRLDGQISDMPERWENRSQENKDFYDDYLFRISEYCIDHQKGDEWGWRNRLRVKTAALHKIKHKPMQSEVLKMGKSALGYAKPGHNVKWEARLKKISDDAVYMLESGKKLNNLERDYLSDVHSLLVNNGPINSAKTRTDAPAKRLVKMRDDTVSKLDLLLGYVKEEVVSKLSLKDNVAGLKDDVVLDSWDEPITPLEPMQVADADIIPAHIVVDDSDIVPDPIMVRDEDILPVIEIIVPDDTLIKKYGSSWKESTIINDSKVIDYFNKKLWVNAPDTDFLNEIFMASTWKAKRSPRQTYETIAWKTQEKFNDLRWVVDELIYRLDDILTCDDLPIIKEPMGIREMLHPKAQVKLVAGELLDRIDQLIGPDERILRREALEKRLPRYVTSDMIVGYLDGEQVTDDMIVGYFNSSTWNKKTRVRGNRRIFTDELSLIAKDLGSYLSEFSFIEGGTEIDIGGKVFHRYDCAEEPLRFADATLIETERVVTPVLSEFASVTKELEEHFGKVFADDVRLDYIPVEEPVKMDYTQQIWKKAVPMTMTKEYLTEGFELIEEDEVTPFVEEMNKYVDLMKAYDDPFVNPNITEVTSRKLRRKPDYRKPPIVKGVYVRPQEKQPEEFFDFAEELRQIEF